MTTKPEWRCVSPTPRAGRTRPNDATPSCRQLRLVAELIAATSAQITRPVYAVDAPLARVGAVISALEATGGTSRRAPADAGCTVIRP